MKIILSGGGTLGPVTPLLAIFDVLKKQYPEAEFLWIGTRNGPERELVEQKGIKYKAITAGKFRRYLSLYNIIDIVKIIFGFFQSLFIVGRADPVVCVSAGGFVSVPVHWAAWLIGIPTWIHQQDIKIGLANRLMGIVAKKITTALSKNVGDFPKEKTEWLGNPVRKEILEGNKQKSIGRFRLIENLPVVFATGGGTGSLRVNQLIVEASQHLRGFAQIIHLSGKERPHEFTSRASKLYDWYHHFEFFTREMADAYAAADVIISRGGFGTITEIAALSKPAILIPKAGHQEENVKYLADGGAVILVDEETSDGNYLAGIIKNLLKDDVLQNKLSAGIAKMMPIAKDKEIIRIFDELAK